MGHTRSPTALCRMGSRQQGRPTPARERRPLAAEVPFFRMTLSASHPGNVPNCPGGTQAAYQAQILACFQLLMLIGERWGCVKPAEFVKKADTCGSTQTRRTPPVIPGRLQAELRNPYYKASCSIKYVTVMAASRRPACSGGDPV